MYPRIREAPEPRLLRSRAGTTRCGRRRALAGRARPQHSSISRVALDHRMIQVMISFLSWLLLFQPSQVPPNPPDALYDESKVPQYTLPDPLVMGNGRREKDSKTWTSQRRPELLKLFET